MNECTITDPITTNQIVEVGLFKPKCFDFEGNTLNDWLKFVSKELCCLINEESIDDLVVESDWDIIRQPKIYRKGKFFQLSGEITGGDVSSLILTLPYTPSERKIIPIAHEFDPADLADFQIFLKIDVDRSVKLYFTGVAPTGPSSKLYLDNVSFFIE